MAPMKPEPRPRDPDLLDSVSLEQLARRWGISRKELRRRLGRQELPFVQVRGKFRVRLADVERYERKR